MIPLLFALLFTSDGHAFPQLSRHGYFNCTSCHVSPSGGGDLTEYGHGLSGELLSMKSTEKESKPFWGLLPDSTAVTPSAFLRALQLYTDNVRTREAKAILMQADLSVAVKHESLTAVASVGRRRIAPPGSDTEHQIFSRTHYLLYSAESGFNLRAGKFLPGYGLNHPNHNLLVRRDTGLNNDTERYNAEASYLGDSFSVLATAIFGPGGDHHSNSKESGGTVSVNKSLNEGSRIGASYYRGSDSPRQRDLFGAYGVISWTKSIYSQLEIDHQKLTAPGTVAGTLVDTKGFVGSHQLTWEALQGVNPYLEAQWENLDDRSSNNSLYTYGLGMNLYPRPHFEFNVFVGQEVPSVLPTTFVAYLMVNLYL